MIEILNLVRYSTECDGDTMINSFRQFITNLSLKHKILLITIFLNILLVGTVTIFGMNIVIKANNKILYQSIASSLSYSATDIEEILGNALTLSNIMIADDVIQRQLSLLQENNDAIVRSSAFKLLYTTTQTYFLEFKKNHINYITLSNDLFTTSTYINQELSTPQQITEILINDAIIKDGAPSWSTEYIEEYGLFLSREVRKIENLSLDKLGVLNINIDLNKIIEDSTHFSHQYERAYYLLFDQNQLIYHSNDLTLDTSNQIQRQLHNNYDILTIDGNKYFAVKGALPTFRWDYICLVSYDKTNEAIWFSYALYIIIILLSVVVSSLLSNALIKIIVKHFDNLILKMRSFRGQASEQIDVGYDYSKRGDEFGILHRQFDSMAEEIQNLIQVNYINELLMKDAKFKALETQMNPHFLYNILESVNWRAKAIGEKQISSMVESLGRLLRATLSEQDRTFSLKKELELVECYMTIQQLRFDDQLQFRLNIDETLLTTKIPKLTIQPLVENAIHYGLEEIAEICIIEIEVFEEDNLVKINVKNSGTQFEEDLLIKLRTREIHPHGLGIGLLNINDRIKITFGDSYGLRFYNEVNTAVAQIILPKEIADPQ